MAITLQPVRNEPQLRVSGDIDAILSVPAVIGASEDGGRYFIALSDGTLVRAHLGDDPAFEILIDGAGLVAIDEAAQTLRIDWSVEWLALSPAAHATVLAQKSVHARPLFQRLVTRTAKAA